MMNLAVRRACVTVAAAAVLLTGCSADTPADDGSAGAEETTQASSETRTVETAQGTVDVPTDPQRVVSLNYSLTGYLFNLDLPVIATTSRDFDYDGSFPEEWADAAATENTEWLTWSADGFDLEAILEADPDVIIAGGLGFPQGLAVDAYDELSKIAPTVIVDAELEPWQEQLEFLAVDVFDDADTFSALSQSYDERVDEVAANITAPEGEAVYVSFTGDSQPYVIIEDSGLPQEMEKLGIEAAPLYAEGDFEPYAPGGDMFTLSSEEVGSTLTQPTMFVMGFNADTTDVETLSENPVYASLPAFSSGQAYDLPYWAVRGNYDEAMATLDVIEELFGS
ncbi:MAG: ABC transporter substrate-binding protein [Micrococcaceae bacterium]